MTRSRARLVACLVFGTSALASSAAGSDGMIRSNKRAEPSSFNHQLVIVYAPAEGTDYWSFHLDSFDKGKTPEQDFYHYSCWKPVAGKMEEANSSKKYDLKPSNVYGMSDCTYTKVNNNGGGGVLNCPSGPKDLTCSYLDATTLPWLVAGNLQTHTCKPDKIVGGFVSGVCLWNSS